MKLLLDENLPHDLRHFLTGHAAFTIDFMGWKGLKNGELLERAAKEGFDALISLDAGIPHQHNPVSLPCAVVILSSKSNKLTDLLPQVTPLLNALAALKPGSVTHI
jgi:predicted nuclease of predicted toxin-antitoxin system